MNAISPWLWLAIVVVIVLGAIAIVSIVVGGKNKRNRDQLANEAQKLANDAAEKAHEQANAAKQFDNELQKNQLEVISGLAGQRIAQKPLRELEYIDVEAEGNGQHYTPAAAQRTS
jgi:FtsZ-interacting cell division protein ZipA